MFDAAQRATPPGSNGASPSSHEETQKLLTAAQAAMQRVGARATELAEQTTLAMKHAYELRVAAATPKEVQAAEQATAVAFELEAQAKRAQADLSGLQEKARGLSDKLNRRSRGLNEEWRHAARRFVLRKGIPPVARQWLLEWIGAEQIVSPLCDVEKVISKALGFPSVGLFKAAAGQQIIQVIKRAAEEGKWPDE
jgi:hypothetical protein